MVTPVQFIDLTRNIASQYQKMHDIIWYTPEGSCNSLHENQKLVLGNFEFGLVYIAPPAIKINLPPFQVPQESVGHGKLNSIAVGVGEYRTQFQCHPIENPKGGILAYYDSIEQKIGAAVVFNLETERMSSFHAAAVNPTCPRALEAKLSTLINASLTESVEIILAAIYEMRGTSKVMK